MVHGILDGHLVVEIMIRYLPSDKLQDNTAIGPDVALKRADISMLLRCFVVPRASLGLPTLYKCVLQAGCLAKINDFQLGLRCV